MYLYNPLLNVLRIFEPAVLEKMGGGGQPSDKSRVNVGGILTINTMLILLDSEESIYKRKITCMSLFP